MSKIPSVAFSAESVWGDWITTWVFGTKCTYKPYVPECSQGYSEPYVRLSFLVMYNRHENSHIFLASLCGIFSRNFFVLVTSFN
jgi:hypothetical protein